MTSRNLEHELAAERAKTAALLTLLEETRRSIPALASKIGSARELLHAILRSNLAGHMHPTTRARVEQMIEVLDVEKMR